MSRIERAYKRTKKSNIHRLVVDQEKPNVRERNIRLAYDNLFAVLTHLDNGNWREADEVLLFSAEALERYVTSYSHSPETEEKLLYDSAIAYYLSGNYARAYVLLRKAQISFSETGTGLAILFLLRYLKNIRDSATVALRNTSDLDKELYSQINSGTFEQDEAIRHVIQNVLHRAFFLLLRYTDTGEFPLIEKAIEVLDIARQIAISLKMRDEWWLLCTTKNMFQEFRRNSLWNQLREMEDDRGLVSRYIRHSKLDELWRSQVQAVPAINDAERSNIALDMPTSSGKTLIAELVILRFLLDHWETGKKCVYVAPFRALAAQVEDSISQNLGQALDIRISQLYGGFDANPTEVVLMEDTRVLIATPEKFEALTRHNPRFVEHIGLVVFDEGHIIDGNYRGLEYELFLHRVVRRLSRQGCRFLFVSAVMPNIEQMAEVFSAKIVSSNWKPTELRFGVFEWKAGRGYRHYMYRGLERDTHLSDKAHEPFVDQEDFSVQSKAEIAAVASVAFAKHATTLVYSSLPRNVESIADVIISVIERLTSKRRSQGFDGYHLPLPDTENTIDELRNCIELAEGMVGENSIVTRAMEKGIVVHHGGVPKKLRTQMEMLMRKGAFRLIVGNYALAQGVNLPVKTILIHHMHRGTEVPASDFWNVCGRAGRAMQENYGEIFWIADSNDVQQKRFLISQYIARASSESLQSSLLRFLASLKREWEQAYPHASVVELCQRLADNEVDGWLSDREIRSLNILDKGILATLMEELSDQALEPANVQEVFTKSLLTIQLQEDEKEGLTKETALKLLAARQQWVGKIPFSERQRFYRTGLALSDCRKLSRMETRIEARFKRAQHFMKWEPSKRAEFLLDICENILFELHEIRNRSGGEWLACWKDIVKYWLLGYSEREIAELSTVSSVTEALGPEAIMRVSQEIYDLCDYRFPWGFDALMSYFTHDNAQIGQERIMPEVVNYFSAMIRYGVHSPVAAILCTYGFSRSLSLSLSEKYRGIPSPSSVLGWLNSLSSDEIGNLKLEVPQDEALLIRLRNKQNPADLNGLLHRHHSWIVDISDKKLIAPLYPGTLLVAECNPPNSVELYSPAFEYLGKLSVSDPPVFDQLNMGRLDVEIDEYVANPDEEYIKLVLAVQS